MLKLLALCVSLVIEIYGPVYGLTPGALSTYVSAPGKVLPGPIPPNSFKASRNVTLTQCAAECSLALHLKEFDCYAFEYLPQNSMCVLTNVTSLVLKGGYLGLLNNPNMNYYEKSKEHFVNLFQPYTGKTLTDQGTYFAVFHNMTLDSCALYCLIETRDTCMSFSYSQTKKACGLSRVFYSADNQQTLTPNPAYTHYQYFTSWPCNASIPWNYTPRAIASPYFPYASVTDVNCYLEIEAPIGKQVELNFSTFFTQKSMCDSGMSGIRIYDGNSPASAELSRLCSTENFVDRRFLSSSGYLYIHFATGSIPMAFKAVFDFFDYDPCESAPCQHGGNCSVTQNGSGACACAAGYTGSRCEVNVDDCASNPCVLGGKCVDLVNDFRCECPRLLGGRLCNEFVGLCYTQPCANGATCSPRGTSDYVCTCLSGYTGPNCSQALPDPCRSSPCLNGATCHSNVLRGTFACQCRPGFQGGLCETNINECASNPCLHNIPCVDMVNDFRCACPEFMVGKRCETFVGECYRKPCQHGTCSPTDRYNYTCTCEASYTGQHCDTRFIDFCNPSPCKHGSCQSFADGPMCKCDFGYSGFFCDHKTDFCADVECAHGECESHDDDFRCKCAPGFEGKYCNETIDHCKTADCHGGFCINTMTSHFCVCKGGRTAPDCGTSVKQCGNLTCINGTCAELGSGLAKCQCFDHYTGSQCETWIDTCGGHPCAHGVCVRQEKGGHTCECDNNYTGLQCDSLIDPCLGNKCVYGFCSSSNSSYECVCGAGYHGQFCQYKPGEIEPSTTPQTQTTVALTTITTSSQHMTSTEITCRCKYGACDADFLNVCLCWHGFDGPLCENFQGCGVHNPCSHGNCTDEAPGSVNCTCDVGFAGELCRVADPCLSNPCHSNGQCNVINLPSGGATYHCTCNEGLTGTRCETSSACAENPCSFGTCIPTDDGHYKYVHCYFNPCMPSV